MTSTPAPTLGWEVIASGHAGPGKRSRHGLVYDKSTKAAVLFGGVVWTPDWNLKNDTWELHGRKWKRIRTSESPPARHRAAMVYLDDSDRSLLFGGQGPTANFFGDTWTYSGQGWQQVPAKGVVPSPRLGHVMAFDERAGATVLFGGVAPNPNYQTSLGDTWLFNGTSWEKMPGNGPAARRYAAFAYDPELEGCLLHGGSDDEAGRRSFGDVWLFKNNSWKQMVKKFETEPRDDHGLGYHQLAKRMVMLEGVAGKRGILVREAAGWKVVEAKPLHPRHQCSPLAWDAELGGLLLHGGETHHEGAQFDATLLLRMPSDQEQHPRP